MVSLGAIGGCELRVLLGRFPKPPELMSRQFTDFATRQGDFWVRKCTEPVMSQRPKTQDPRQGQFGRQSSCPTPSRPQMAFDGFEGLGLANLNQTINEESQEEKQEPLCRAGRASRLKSLSRWIKHA
eukprot:s4042_g7.t1